MKIFVVGEILRPFFFYFTFCPKEGLGLAFSRAQDQPTLDPQDPLTVPHSSFCLILQKIVPLPPPTLEQKLC